MGYLEQLEKDYEEYLIECRSALRITLAKMENLRERLEHTNDRIIFDNVESRIKTFDSAVNKCRRKNYEHVNKKGLMKREITRDDFTIDTIRTHMQDVAGVRITTVFQDDIYFIYDAIKGTDMIVSHTDDYIKKPKKNGYRSLHIILMVRISTNDGAKLVPVEVQIRDKAMDLWAAMDHIIRYKNPNPSPDAEQKFLELSETLCKFDESVISLRDFDTNNLISFSPKSPE